MKKRAFTIIILAFFITSVIFFVTNSGFAQTSEDRIEELRRQIEVLEEQAKQYRGSIIQNQQQARTLASEISSLKQQISRLEIEMAATGKKIDRTNLEITTTEGNIHDTQQKISTQEQAITELLQYLYQRDQESVVGVLMKSSSLQEYFRQEQYALTVDDNLLDLIGDLKKEEDNLTKHKQALENKKEELLDLKDQQEAQKTSLASVKRNRDNLLVQTKGQEAKFQKLLSDVEKRRAQFFAELRSLESQVIAGGLYLVHVTATGLPSKGAKLFKFPEDDYRITQGYGMTTYARRGAYGGAPHNGVDMASGFGSPINAIGDGTIVAAGTNDGWGNWIAVKHTAYSLVSVYGHLSSFGSIRVGSPVKAGQAIGYEGSTGNSTGSHLHLSLYKEFFTYQNSKKNGQLYFNYFEGSINPLDYM